MRRPGHGSAVTCGWSARRRLTARSGRAPCRLRRPWGCGRVDLECAAPRPGPLGDMPDWRRSGVVGPPSRATHSALN